MIYLLTVKEILILSNNIYLFTKSIIIRINYILTRNYIHFKEPYQFVQGNISSFSEIYSFRKIISIQGNISYPISRNISPFKFKAIYVHSRKLYLLNIVAFAE